MHQPTFQYISGIFPYKLRKKFSFKLIAKLFQNVASTTCEMNAEVCMNLFFQNLDPDCIDIRLNYQSFTISREHVCALSNWLLYWFFISQFADLIHLQQVDFTFTVQRDIWLSFDSK